ncbi:MAG: PilZ domain-containing protein [Magnetococcales bacterium]|nr:PilZ domain-containing protein [Magnetococcales bacterium]
MDKSPKSARDNPFPGNRGKAFNRLEPDVPFWWRKITRHLMTARTQQLRVDGKLPFSRINLEQFFTDHLPKLRKRSANEQSAPALTKRVDILTSLEDKLDAFVAMLQPKNGQGRIHQTPIPIQFGGQRFAFWEKDPDLQTGDQIEIHLGLFPDDYILLHGYAQVIQTATDPQSGLTRVFCEMVIMGHDPVRSAHIMPRLHKQPDVPKADVSHARPLPTTSVSTTTETPAQPARDLTRVEPAPPAAPLSAREIQTNTPLVSEPLFQVDAGPTDDNAANRRQAYRVNDDIAFSWKVVSHEDIAEAQNYFRQHDRLPIRNKESRIRDLLDQYVANLQRLDKRFSRTEVLLSWFRFELLALFQRAMRSSDEETVLMCAVQLHEISNEIVSRPESITPQFAQVMTLIRKRLEQQQKNSVLDPLLAANRINEGKDLILKTNREIDKIIQEVATLTPALTQKVELFHNSMGAIQLPQTAGKIKRSSGTEHMTKSQVNLSATGVAFRTSETFLEKGDYVQLNLELSPNGTDFITYTAYGQIVMIKQLSVGKPLRIATQFILIPRKMEEHLGAHIARRQRELLLVK